MKIFYDTEFLENGETIRLISIGMIREDGKTLYRVVNDPKLMIDTWNHAWLRKNVIPSLPLACIYPEHDIDDSYKDLVVWESHHPHYGCVKPRWEIEQAVKDFVLDTPNPELWAYYSAYDHVALCQLFGRMIDLPTGFPMYTNDLKSEIARLGNPRVPEQATGLHNALSDAIWNKETYKYLEAFRTTLEASEEPYKPGTYLQEIFDRGSRD